MVVNCSLIRNRVKGVDLLHACHRLPGNRVKDKTDRTLSLNEELRAVIEELLTAAKGNTVGYVFPGRPGPHRAKNFARTTLNELKSLAAVAGIPAKKLTSHNFRRYFVSQCADCGIDILCVMEWVGHDDWEMVRRYYRLRDDHAQESMKRFTTGVPVAANPSKGHDATLGDPRRSFGEHLGKEADKDGKKAITGEDYNAMTGKDLYDHAIA